MENNNLSGFNLRCCNLTPLLTQLICLIVNYKFTLFYYACNFRSLNSYYGSYNEVFKQYSEEYFNQTNL